MSRIGKKPIQVPVGVTVRIEGRAVHVKGPKGELAMTLHHHVNISCEGEVCRVTVKNPSTKLNQSLWGTTARLLENLVHGVTHGFVKRLEINGVGYRVAMEGTAINLSLGFSHPVKFPLPQGVTASVEKNVIAIQGIDKQVIGEVAAQIRKLRPPEPYQGKGIRYQGEVVRRKAGKQVKAAGAGAK